MNARSFKLRRCLQRRINGLFFFVVTKHGPERKRRRVHAGEAGHRQSLQTALFRFRSAARKADDCVLWRAAAVVKLAGASSSFFSLQAPQKLMV